MSKKVDDAIKWLKSFRSGKIWLSKLKSKDTIRVYVTNFKVFCEAVDMTPDELIAYKMEGQRLVGDPKEFQMEELHDLTLSEMRARHSPDPCQTFICHSLAEKVENLKKGNQQLIAKITGEMA